MAITERAQRNHDELFPNHVSTLKSTDPELIEIFDNWAFDELLLDAPLDTKTRVLVQLAAILACQGINEFRVMSGAALNVGITPVQLKEVVYQAVPYLGMAKVFDFLHVTNDVLKSRGVQLPLPAQSGTTRDSRFEQGLAVQKRLFGSTIEHCASSPRRRDDERARARGERAARQEHDASIRDQHRCETHDVPASRRPSGQSRPGSDHDRRG